jgi:hypothetical protein
MKNFYYIVFKVKTFFQFEAEKSLPESRNLEKKFISRLKLSTAMTLNHRKENFYEEKIV